MATIRSIFGLASYLGLMMSTTWAQDGLPTSPPMLPPPAQVNVPANRPALPATAQVRVYRLHYAASDLMAEEFYSLFAAQNVRVASDPRTNSVIVAGPPAVQGNVAGLIKRLDVPQPSNDTVATGGLTAAAGGVPFEGRRSDVALKAIELLTDRRTLRPGDEIAVVKVSPAAARALESVTRTQSQQAVQYQALKPPLDGTFNEPPQPTGGAVKTLRLSHDQVTAIAQALHSLSAQGPSSGVVVVVPPKAPATTSRQGTASR